MLLKNTGAYTQTNEYVLSGDLPDILGKINYSGLQKDINAEALAREDASYIQSIGKMSDGPLTGEIEIRADLEKLRDVAYRTYSDKAEDCVKEAREIFEKTDPENFRNELKAICVNGIKDCEANLEAIKEEYKHAKAYEAEAHANLDKFREKNGLTERVADIVPPGRLFFGVALIAFIVLLETIGNSLLFGGILITSVVLAFVPSFLNCLFGIFTAISYRYTHADRFKKRGCVGVLLFASLAFSLNLGLAHYRMAMFNVESIRAEIDALEKKDDMTQDDYRRLVDLKRQTNADVVALENLKKAPFDFGGMQSIFLFFLGLVCSVLNGAKYYHLDDPYPGYGKFWKKRDDAREVLIGLKKKFADEKADCFRQTRDEMKKYYDELKADTRAPFDNLLRTMGLYWQDLPRFEDDLEGAGRRLLASYYRKYAEIAPDFVPDRAAKPYELSRKRQENVMDELKRYQQKLKQSYDANKIASVYEEELQKMSSHYDKIGMDETEKETL